jgi:hypothetical protein
MDPTLQYMMSMMAQMQEQARYDRAEAARLAREQVLRAEQAQERARLDNIRLQEQIVALQRDRASAPKATHLRTGKPPQFDLENDKRKFAVWKSKWGYYVESSGIADLTGINKTRTSEGHRRSSQITDSSGGSRGRRWHRPLSNGRIHPCTGTQIADWSIVSTSL